MCRESRSAPTGARLIYLSPRGAPFMQAKAQELAQEPGITLICGRFEGLDQRVIDHYGIEEISLGDYVLTGGEIAAQALYRPTCARGLRSVCHEIPPGNACLPRLETSRHAHLPAGLEIED